MNEIKPSIHDLVFKRTVEVQWDLLQWRNFTFMKPT